MNIKKSIEENKTEILNSLPNDLRDEFLKGIDKIEEPAPPLNLETVENLVAATLPKNLKSAAKNVGNELLNAPEAGVSKEDQKTIILNSLPEALKAGFLKDWKD